MSDLTLASGIDRHSYRKTKTPRRGFVYRYRADGSKCFYGYVPGRGRVQLQASTEREAVAEWNELRGKAGRGEQLIVPSKLKVEAVMAEHLADIEPTLSPGWAADYRRAAEHVILPVWGHRRLASITPQDIIALDRELRAKHAESTAANYIKPARGMFEFALLKGYRESNPFSRVPRGRLASCNTTREHREWTTAEVENLIRVAYERDERREARTGYGLAIELKLRTGLRIGELLGVQYGDIVSEQTSSGTKVSVLQVRRQWTKDGRVAKPKTAGSVRRIPLPPALSAKIAKRKLSSGAGDEDFIFASKGGKPPTQGNFRRRGWDEAVAAAGMTDGPKVTPHDARHAFASMMAEFGLTSADVAEVMGHTTAGVTERIYTHAFNREAREQRIRQAQEAAADSSRV